MTREQMRKVFNSPSFTKAEKQLLEQQFIPEHGSSFKNALFAAIFRADPDNQRKLALGFPHEVDAVQHWTHGGLREKMEAVANEAA